MAHKTWEKNTNPDLLNHTDDDLFGLCNIR